MSTASLCRTEKDYMIQLMVEYRDEKGHGPINLGFVADWAIRNRGWRPPNRSIRSDLKSRLFRAARMQYHTDRQGRQVRIMHAARYARLTKNGQLVFETIWDHIEKMSAKHGRKSFTQRWDQIANECRSLKRDTDSYRDNNPNAEGQDFQLTFNFEFILDDSFVTETETIEPSNYQSSKKPR